MLQCHVKSCKNGFPLALSNVELEEFNVDFNQEFLVGILNRIEWNALVETAQSLGIDTLPEQISATRDPADASQETLQALHSLLLEVILLEEMPLNVEKILAHGTDPRNESQADRWFVLAAAISFPFKMVSQTCFLTIMKYKSHTLRPRSIAAVSPFIKLFVVPFHCC
jgi:hypothetical protein